MRDDDFYVLDDDDTHAYCLQREVFELGAIWLKQEWKKVMIINSDLSESVLDVLFQLQILHHLGTILLECDIFLCQELVHVFVSLNTHVNVTSLKLLRTVNCTVMRPRFLEKS